MTATPIIAAFASAVITAGVILALQGFTTVPTSAGIVLGLAIGAVVGLMVGTS